MKNPKLFLRKSKKSKIISKKIQNFIFNNFIETITENASGFVELSPSDNGAQTSVADVLRRRRQTHRPDVVAEPDGLFHPQDRYIVDESSVHVFRMDENIRNNPHLLVRRQQVRTATQRPQTGNPVIILRTASTTNFI